MMILSPAKTLDLTPYLKDSYKETFPIPTRPCCDIDKTNKIANAMKLKNKSSLEKLLGISPKLADTAHKYWKDFSTKDSITSNSAKNKNIEKPAIFSFSGAAYQGLQASTFLDNPSSTQTSRALSYLQSNLAIIDPLYGVLRPMDLMQPYRLEMATKGLQLENSDCNDVDTTKTT